MGFHHCWSIIWVFISTLVKSIGSAKCGLFDCEGLTRLIRSRTAKPFFVCLAALHTEFAWFLALWLLIYCSPTLVLIREICSEEILLCLIIKGDAFASVDHLTSFKNASANWVRNLPLNSVEISVYLVLFFNSKTIEKVGYALPVICSFCKRVLHSKGVAV